MTKNWAAFEQSVRSAAPGSVVYAPVPYPRTRADILKDFRYAYAQLRQGMAESDVPENERAFYNRFMAGKLLARIETVQNWTPTRCLPESRNDFYWLLLLTDADTGVELGRFALHETGLFSQFSPQPPSGSNTPGHRFARSIEAFDALTKLVQARYGLIAQNVQHVDVYGTPRCRPLAPCTAFESAGMNYILSLDDLFAVTNSARRALRVDRPTLEGIKESLSNDEAVISFGAEAWVVGRRVQPIH